MMMRPSWQKVLADLWINKTRTLLVVASIAVGVFAIGAIASDYIILNEDIGVSYSSAQPANIEIITDPFDEDFIKSVKKIPGVLDVEGRHMISVRVGLDGKGWKPLDIMATEDYRETNINLLSPVTGTIYPEDRQLMVREDLMNSTGLKVGDQALIQLADGTIRQMPVVGTVGDQYAAGDFADPPRGYMTLDSVDWLGGYELYNRLYVRVENGNDEDFIEAVAKDVEDKVERSQRTVYRKNTNKTSEHPMESTVLAIVGVLGALGILIMLLSSSLIINTLNALLTQHRRQIGVMKLIGGRSIQISIMYNALIIAYGLIALVIAVPLGIIAGYQMASFLGNMMSIELQGFRVVPIAVIMQVILAIAIPLIAGYIPIRKGAKTSVRRVISEETQAETKGEKGVFDRSLAWFKWLSRPLLLSIRNTFRRKGRLVLTLFTLIMAGAIFISVFNVRYSISSFMDTLSQHYLADVMITFNQPYRTVKVEQDIFQIPGVERVESWGAAYADVLDNDDEVDATMILLAPPRDTRLLDPDIVAGRWLEPDEQNALVVSDSIWDEYPDFQIGDSLRVKIQDNRTEEWPVVGVFRFIDMVGNLLAYGNYEQISQLTNTPGQANNYRVVAKANTLENQNELSRVIDTRLRELGYKISDVEAGKVRQQQQSQAFNIIVIFLLMMAILTAIVGSIGLMGTMGMNVLERTREIGVMRAIGAVDNEIIKSVVVEGMMIGLISFLVAVLFSFPISYVLLGIISRATVGTSLPLQITPLGFIIWLGVVIILSIIASMWPARSAARLTIREVLAYE